MNRATILLVQASLLGACGGGAPAAAHPEPAAECVAVDTSVPLAVSRIEGDGVVVHTLVAPDSSAAVTSHVVETEGHLSPPATKRTTSTDITGLHETTGGTADGSRRAPRSRDGREGAARHERR
ncbi:MAG: hypothetical protein RLO52_22120, partial [Sandaracinaceae bacterium]